MKDHATTAVMREKATQLPGTLQQFLRTECHLDTEAFIPLAAAELPDRDRLLLAHHRDMTSTLAAFHGSALRVELLQCVTRENLYLREVFLRTTQADRAVEYGVIAMALDQFGETERAAIAAHQSPLGAVLHQFKIAFVSAPIGFFSVAPEARGRTPLAHVPEGICYGRFNRLSKPTGEPLAWIMEILPP